VPTELALPLKRLCQRVVIQAALDASHPKIMRDYPTSPATIAAWAEAAGLDALTIVAEVQRRKDACRPRGDRKALGA